MTVDRSQRFTRDRRCPICGGCDQDPRDKGKRCMGFLSTDGDWCHCSREERAGSLDQDGAQTYAHKMHGDCRCGESHGEARPNAGGIEAVYPYTDEAGAILFEVVRKVGKQFRQRKPDGAGGYDWKLNGVRRVPYRLPDLLAADPLRPVYVVEGEKDADNMRARGEVATCNAGGAGKWHTIADAAKAVLAGRDVIVIADKDDAGRKHAQQVAASLSGCAQTVKVAEVPTGKDASDYFASGGTMEALALLLASLPFWTPAVQSSAQLAVAPPEMPGDDDPSMQDHPLADVLKPTEPERLTPPQRALRLGRVIVRHPCGLATLDEAMRGGLPAGKRLFLVGGPGTFKSAIMICWAVALLRAGWHVSYIAADEAADDVLIRVGRTMGYDRQALEDGNHPLHDEIKAAFAAELEPFAFELIDAGEDPAPQIETVARGVAQRRGDQPGALFVDSLQQADSAGSRDCDNPRAATDSKIVAIKYASDTCGLLVVASSEANRAYSSARSENRIEAIGAGKESSSIEFAAHVSLVLRAVKDEGYLADGVLAKNRFGKRDVKLRLQFDPEKHTVTEAETEDEGEKGKPSPAKTEAVAIDVEKYVLDHAGCSTNMIICAKIAGRVATQAAIDWLVQNGRIVSEIGPRRAIQWKVTQ